MGVVALGGVVGPLDSLDVFVVQSAHLALYVDIQGHHLEVRVFWDPQKTYKHITYPSKIEWDRIPTDP